MSVESKKIEGYLIPFKERSRLKWTNHLLYIFMIGLFTAFIFIPFDNVAENLVSKSLCILFDILFLSIWWYTGILRKSYVELTEESIIFKIMFKTQIVKWYEIYDIQVFTQNKNTMLGIILKEKVRKRKESFGTQLSDMYGGIFSVRIPLSQFQNIDIEKLYTTMTNKLIDVNKLSNDNIKYNTNEFQMEKNENLSTDIKYTSQSSDIEENENSTIGNYIVAMLKLFILSIIVGSAYGLSIYIFKANLIIVPMFGSIAIVYFYSKTNKKRKINIFTRIILGLICALQVYLAVIIVVLLGSSGTEGISYLDIINQYFEYLIEKPMDQGVFIIISIFCFWCGAFQGYKFKFQMRIKKLFMKRYGKYFYEKNGRSITIYLIDPVRFDAEKDKKFITEIVQGCLIEKSKKSVKGFYIPTNYFDDLGITINHDASININDICYYKIDLGGNGNCESYVFPCSLITNSKKQVEIIEIETP
jgi:hypothetical protein